MAVVDARSAMNPVRSLPLPASRFGRLRVREISGSRRREPADHGHLLVDVGFEEPGEAVEVAAAFDVANHCHQRVGVDQLVKRHVVQLELA